MERFPDISVEDADDNPAIQVFGRRFYKDQTPIEYLAELFLVFSSPKNEDGTDKYSFPIFNSTPKQQLKYYPCHKLGLKLFAFLGASKLATRHPMHMKAFKDSVVKISELTTINGMDRMVAVRLIQGLFAGFVGVAGDRTWTAHTFLPASSSLLSREVLWRHTGANGAVNNLPADAEWDEAWKYFNTGAHAFMARGGELLFLQLQNLFNAAKSENLLSEIGLDCADAYGHLTKLQSISALKVSLEEKFKKLLEDGDRAIGPIGNFIESALSNSGISSEPEGELKEATLGWVPRKTATEAMLFAWEANNICSAQRGGLQKISLLRDLCVLQVMRSLCFQASRVSDIVKIEGFSGGYAWVACSTSIEENANSKLVAISTYDKVEGMLYRALRVFDDYTREPSTLLLDKGDENVVRLFRKIGKQVGLIVPRKGAGMRMTLPSHMVRLLVAALIPPGNRLRLDNFYARIFAHYGLAIEQSLMIKVLNLYESNPEAATLVIDSSWFEEELQKGGYLIPLSDAVSIVVNPYKG
jgi:hypothetical protein